ncbi:DUF305 domain-containing protein [Actinophytocola sp.]|uniref:DUF305 domain-containing protein n=1 Tax=Actinophytocola sp. TaxID=1872138 RepID=UPI003D6C057D
MAGRVGPPGRLARAPAGRPAIGIDPLRRLAAVLTGLLLLAGCGGTLGGTTGTVETAPPLAGTFNDTDVMFLQMLIPHHEQGIELAGIAAARASAGGVRDLAAAVEATQNDELADMREWLRAWNQPLAADPDPRAHAGHGGMPATDPKVIAALRRIPAGPDFDRMFLNLLTAHQHGAVELARMQVRAGKYQEATDLAARIVESRTAQIRQMARLRG